MPRADHFTGVEVKCVMCANPIPPHRKKDAITCSPECTKDRKNYLRSLQDMHECRYCYKPSTPEDRVRFKAWRKFEKDGMVDPQFVAQVLETTRLVRENHRLRNRIAELEAKEVDDGTQKEVDSGGNRPDEA